MTKIRLIRQLRNYLLELQQSGAVAAIELSILSTTYNDIFKKIIEGIGDDAILMARPFTSIEIMLILKNVEKIYDNDLSIEGAVLKRKLLDLCDDLFCDTSMYNPI